MKITRIAQLVAVSFGVLAVVGCDGQGGVEAVKGGAPAIAPGAAAPAPGAAPVVVKKSGSKSISTNGPLAAPE